MDLNRRKTYPSSHMFKELQFKATSEISLIIENIKAFFKKKWVPTFCYYNEGRKKKNVCFSWELTWAVEKEADWSLWKLKLLKSLSLQIFLFSKVYLGQTWWHVPVSQLQWRQEDCLSPRTWGPAVTPVSQRNQSLYAETRPDSRGASEPTECWFS